jgi:hypothetical protein
MWVAAAALLGCSAPLDADGDGYDAESDCDDGEASVHPGAPEKCDGRDSDCDGALGRSEVDADGDGQTLCGGDCDDEDPERGPSGPGVPLEGLLTVLDAWLTIVPGDGYPIIEGTSIAQVVGPGDVNGDGLDDLLVTGGRGPAFLYYAPFCRGTVELGDADVRLGLPSGSHWFVHRIFEVGDLNGDGFDDVQVDSWIWYGPLEGERSWEEADLRIWPGHNMGAIDSLAAGDWNGDGFGDLAVGSSDSGGWPPSDELACGCPIQDCENLNCYFPADAGTGQVALMLGPIEGELLDTENAAAWLVGEVDNSSAGTSVGNAGDVNGDGLDDLVVGAPGFGDTVGAGPVGAAYLALSPFQGVQYLEDAHARWEGPCGTAWDGVGKRVAGVGDVTGDGAPDLVIGGGNCEPYLLADAATPGRYVLGADVPPAFVETASPNIAGPGDFDADGVGDFLTGGYRTMLSMGRVPEAADSASWEPRFDISVVEMGDPSYYGIRDAHVVGDVNQDGASDFAFAGEVWPSDYKAALFLGNAP